MRKLMLLTIFIILLMVAGIVSAQTVNDPADNWCYDGGPLAGRCTTDDETTTIWYWFYGFYRAQIAKGALSVNDIPAEYRVGIVDSSSQSADAIRDADGNIIAGR